VIGQKVFQRWCKLIERADLIDDPRFATDDLRGENGAELSRIMQAWCAGRGRDECIEILSKASIGCGPVLSPAEVMSGAMDLRATYLRDVPFPGSAPVPIAPPPARLSHGAVEVTRPPLLGEHSDEVLSDCGFTSEQIAGLRGTGTI